MSTLGTFAKYSDFGILESIDQARQRNEPGYASRVVRKAKAKRIASNPIIQGMNPDRVEKVRYQGRRANIATQGSSTITRPTTETKSVMKVTKQSATGKKRVADGFAEIAKKKGLKMRNIGIGAGLGVAGLAGLGATAYNLRNSNRRSEMSFGSAYANFAEALVGSKSGVSPITGKPYTNKSKEFGEVTDAMRTGTGTPLTPEQLDKLKTSKNNKKQFDKTQIEDTQKSLKAYANQRGIEKQIDSGGDIYKGAKGAGDYVNRTSALLTSPERKVIAAGKTSKNSFVKGLSEGAEKFGRAGYKTGATGLRGVGNALVGRTVTGKVARLGAAGIGLSAIGGAMKRNRQERG